jgi:hypothetical protein
MYLRIFGVASVLAVGLLVLATAESVHARVDKGAPIGSAKPPPIPCTGKSCGVPTGPANGGPRCHCARWTYNGCIYICQ